MAKWTEEEEAKLTSLYLKVPLETLVKEFPRHSLAAILSKGNKLVYENDRTWSPYEDEILVNEYCRLSAKKIRSLYLRHRSLAAIQNRVRKLGLKKPSELTYNETFFDYWSPELAYVLGLLITDGSITKNVSRGSYVVSWSLKKEDSIPLFMMQQLFGGSMVEINKTNYELHVYGRWIIEKLEALNFDTRRKAERDHVPDVPYEYTWHFIRGLVDGDGWVNNSWDKKFRVGFCGRKWLVSWLADRWGELLSRKIPSYKHNPNVRIEVYNDDAAQVCREMYKGCGLLFIPRKRNVYFEYLRKKHSAVRRDYPLEGE